MAKHFLSKEILHETKMVLQYSVLNSVRLGGSDWVIMERKEKNQRKINSNSKHNKKLIHFNRYNIH